MLLLLSFLPAINSLSAGPRLRPTDLVQMRKVSAPVSSLAGAKIAYTVSQYNVTTQKSLTQVFVDDDLTVKEVTGDKCGSLFWMSDTLLAGICSDSQV
jgi:hypothetical protein